MRLAILFCVLALIPFAGQPAFAQDQPAKDNPPAIGKQAWNQLWGQKNREIKQAKPKGPVRPRKSYNHSHPIPPIAVYQMAWQQAWWRAWYARTNSSNVSVWPRR